MPLTAIYQGKSNPIWNFNESDRGKQFNCKYCGSNMILVLGNQVIHHFRHYDNTDGICSHVETQEHLKMKMIVADIFREYGYDIEVEKIVKNDDGKINIIDVLISKGKRRIAIECQYSNISSWEVKERTRDLGDKKFFVLWLLDSESYNVHGYSRQLRGPEKFLHRINYGRCFYLWRTQKTIISVKFKRIQKYNDFTGTSYYLKNTRKFACKVPIGYKFTLGYTTDINSNKQYRMARIND